MFVGTVEHRHKAECKWLVVDGRRNRRLEYYTCQILSFDDDNDKLSKVFQEPLLDVLFFNQKVMVMVLL